MLAALIRNLKIAVTGGVGLTGRCAVRDLLRSDTVEEVVVADLDTKSLQNLKKTLHDGRIVIKRVDVRKHENTSEVLRGCDVVINAVQYYFNLDVMASAYSAGVNYLDFGGLYHTTLKQLKMFQEKFRKRGIIGVVGMGAQPGVSNLMVKHAVGFLDETETIEIRDGWCDMTKTDSAIYFTWSPQTFFDESSQDAIVFQNGKYFTRPPFSEHETVSFPPPVGKVPVYLSLHSELATIPRSFEDRGVKNVSWKEGSSDFWKIKLLADTGLTSTKEIVIDGSKISPRKFFLKLLASRGLVNIPKNVVPNDFEITRVQAFGTKDGKKRKVVVDCFFIPFKPWLVSCGQYGVGIPGSIAAQSISEGGGHLPKGVFPPEMALDPTKFFSELEKRKISVRTRIN